jgi:hypothetical protein
LNLSSKMIRLTKIKEVQFKVIFILEAIAKSKQGPLPITGETGGTWSVSLTSPTGKEGASGSTSKGGATVVGSTKREKPKEAGAKSSTRYNLIEIFEDVANTGSKAHTTGPEGDEGPSAARLQTRHSGEQGHQLTYQPLLNPAQEPMREPGATSSATEGHERARASIGPPEDVPGPTCSRRKWTGARAND